MKPWHVNSSSNLQASEILARYVDKLHQNPWPEDYMSRLKVIKQHQFLLFGGYCHIQQEYKNDVRVLTCTQYGYKSPVSSNTKVNRESDSIDDYEDREEEEEDINKCKWELYLPLVSNSPPTPRFVLLPLSSSLCHYVYISFIG
jgi:hypothetical protein